MRASLRAGGLLLAIATACLTSAAAMAGTSNPPGKVVGSLDGVGSATLTATVHHPHGNMHVLFLTTEQSGRIQLDSRVTCRKNGQKQTDSGHLTGIPYFATAPPKSKGLALPISKPKQCKVVIDVVMLKGHYEPDPTAPITIKLYAKT